MSAGDRRRHNSTDLSVKLQLDKLKPPHPLDRRPFPTRRTMGCRPSLSVAMLHSSPFPPLTNILRPTSLDDK
jgi:hypothetical protein